MLRPTENDSDALNNKPLFLLLYALAGIAKEKKKKGS